MPVTFNKQVLKPVVPQGANLEFVSLYAPEDALQTFVSNEVVTVAAGFVQQAATGAALAWYGVSMGAAHNDAVAGTSDIQVCPAIPGFCFYANLLGAAAVDRLLVATDLGTSYEVEYSATLIGGTAPGWYVNGAAAGAPAGKVVSFWGDQPGDLNIGGVTIVGVGSTDAQKALVGDTNPRCLFSLLAAQTAFTV